MRGARALGILAVAALLPAGVLAQEQPASAGEKWQFFEQETVAPYILLASGVTAAVSQATASDPRYGSNRGALAMRFAASTGDNISQNFFSDFAMASLFHQDTRYVRRGGRHGFWNRFGYAVSRAFVTRTDAGDRAVNWSNLVGCGLQAGLSNAYYPPASRSATATLINWSNSLAGSGFGNLFPEFLPDFERWLKRHHL